MNIEIQKSTVTSMNMEDSVRYEIVAMDEELSGNFDELRKLRDYIDAYVKREEAASVPATL